jgi:hypothetical protein
MNTAERAFESRRFRSIIYSIVLKIIDHMFYYLDRFFSTHVPYRYLTDSSSDAVSPSLGYLSQVAHDQLMG